MWVTIALWLFDRRASSNFLSLGLGQSYKHWMVASVPLLPTRNSSTLLGYILTTRVDPSSGLEGELPCESPLSLRFSFETGPIVS